MSENRRFEIRGETRLKNAKLVRAREEVGMSQKEFAVHVGILYTSYNAYENLRAYPTEKHRKILSSYCDCSEEELFPQELKQYAEGEEPRKLIQIAEVEPSRLLGAVRRQALLVATSTTPAEEVEDGSLREVIEEAFSHLKPREEKILRLYFGLDEEPMDLERIGVLLGVTRERVRQIMQKAISRLRDSNRADPLAQAGGIELGIDEPIEKDWRDKDGVTHIGALRSWRERQRQRRIG